MPKKDQHVKNFVFSVVEDRKNSEDITYTIGIGNKSFTSLITLWSNSFSRIRERFEEYLRDGHTVIELDFDTEITCISLNREGTNVNVEIVPNYWVDKEQTPLFGMCQEKDVLSKLYYGLLYATTLPR